MKMNKIEENCVFCKIAQDIIKTVKISVSNNFIAILDTHPKTKGHTLIIPKKHFVTLLDIPNNLGEELLTFTKKICSQILDNKQGNGFNILMNNLECAGQVVKHAYIHILPRNEKDGFRIIS